MKTNTEMALDRRGRARPQASRHARRTPWAEAWHLLTSVRVALILILVLTSLSLVGALISQAPPDVAASPQEYAYWLAQARERFGPWTTPLNALGIFTLFQTWWFKGLGALLLLSILACSVNRWKALWVPSFRPRVRMGDAFYQRRGLGEELHQGDSDPARTSLQVRLALRQNRYAVRQETEGDAVYMLCLKNRWAPFGTYLIHLSLVLFILGAITGSMLGFRSRSFMVPEGSIRDVGYGTGLTVKLLSFDDEYYPEGPPKDFRSDIEVYRNGTQVAAGTVRVNTPLDVGGTRFHQSFFGQAVVMQVRDGQGNVVFDDGVALGWVTGKKPLQRPLGMFSIPSSDLSAYVVAPVSARAPDPFIPAGQVRLEVYQAGQAAPITARNLPQGQGVPLGDYTYTFVREGQFSGLQVVRDPGGNLVWTASTLFVLGLFMVFYFHYHRVWVRCVPDGKGGTRVELRPSSKRESSTSAEFERVTQAVARALSGPPRRSEEM